jgi:hypothetical protein
MSRRTIARRSAAFFKSSLLRATVGTALASTAAFIPLRIDRSASLAKMTACDRAEVGHEKIDSHRISHVCTKSGKSYVWQSVGRQTNGRK